MKRKTLLLFLATITATALLFTGCGNKTSDTPPVTEETVEETEATEPEEIEPVEEVTDDKENVTLGNRLAKTFEELASVEGTSTLEIAEGIVGSVHEISLVAADIEAGYFNGFDDEISEFNHATMFGPMISAIPFVGYVFETDDTVALVEKLEKTHDLNWNICNQADEAVSKVVGNYVFYVMCPSSIEPAEIPEVTDIEETEEVLPPGVIIVDENGNIIDAPAE